MLAFELKDRCAYRLYRSNDLVNFKLIEDFGVISGNHSVQLPAPLAGRCAFYVLEAYLP